MRAYRVVGVATLVFLSQAAVRPLALDDTVVSNYAFDVTPNDLVTAIITEKGVARAPYIESLKKQFEEEV